ncbi:malonate decarboxylase holo-ACP synthase [Lacrimispora sp. JR3]|uniref:malonate decarboxylase holo-ACP synthase n=1 Tax=Lacrimispora sinapis TaxID=3111456 RepID=UPI00374A5FE1
MELRVHDLLRISSVKDLQGDFTEAEWLLKAVTRAPFVVVRRAPFTDGLIPAGIRGENRNQRLAAAVLSTGIKEVITPEQISAEMGWRTRSHIRKSRLFEPLETLHKIFKSYQILWGPVGSVGFELASKADTVTETSDLDIVMRTPEVLPVCTAKDIVKRISELPVKLDVQMETPNGSVALEEYARGGSKLLLRTVHGPKLVEDPWEPV